MAVAANEHEERGHEKARLEFRAGSFMPKSARQKRAGSKGTTAAPERS
jgi:hypothetical protein